MVATDETQRETESPPLTIWRYIDFVKFVSMLESSALHFTRIDQFSDPYEGHYSEASYAAISKLFELPENRNAYENPQHLEFGMELGTRLHRASVFVNCWHINESESLPMWKAYGDSGIAIRSTDTMLANALRYSVEPVYLTPINYINFETETMRHSPQTHLNQVGTKRHYFAYEREFRAIWIYPPPKNGDGIPDLENIADHPAGWKIDVDLEKVIDSVFVSPGRPNWYRELVESVLHRYGLDSVPVAPSMLDSNPRILRANVRDGYKQR